MFNVYLQFGGNGREALEFYQSIFGGEVTALAFNEMPATEDMPPLSDEQQSMMMHGLLTLPNGTQVMASDNPFDFNGQRGVTIQYPADSAAEADRVWGLLSPGATVEMELGETFWAEKFGILADRFGTNWMVNYEGAKRYGAEHE